MSKTTPNTTPIVAYYRVSRVSQGAAGLGIAAQKAAVAEHVASTGATLLEEFTEVESGRKTDRLKLTHALALCRATGAVLLIAKLDRLARNVRFLSKLMEGDVKFRALDLPGATPFTLHVLAAVAEQEATAISARTRAALAAARARGIKLGRPENLTDKSRQNSLTVRRARAAARHDQILPTVLTWDRDGWSLQRMADTLTALKVPLPRPPRDGRPARWQYVQVQRLVALARRAPLAPIAPPLAPIAPAVPSVQPGPTPTGVRVRVTRVVADGSRHRGRH